MSLLWQHSDFIGHWHSIRLKGEGISISQLWVLVSGLLSAGPWLVGPTRPCYIMHSGKKQIHLLSALQVMYKAMTSTTNTSSSRAANVFIINCYQKCQLKVTDLIGDHAPNWRLKWIICLLRDAKTMSCRREQTLANKLTRRYTSGEGLIWSGRKHWV